MGKKSSRFQSAVMLFWVFFFITIEFCCANSATHQEAFPENEGKPENGRLGNTRSVHHIEEYKLRSIKNLFNKRPLLQPKPITLKKPFIKYPSRVPCIQRLSSNPSVPALEENPEVHMVERQNFLLIRFLKSLFPGFKRPALEPIPCVSDSKFLHIPRFMGRIPRPLPIVRRPFQGFKKPISEPVPLVRKPIPEFEKPVSESFPPHPPTSEFEKPVSDSFPYPPASGSEKSVLEPFPLPPTKKSTPEFEKPISEPVPQVEKPIPKDEKHIPKAILSEKKSNLENKKHISKPIPSIKKNLSPPQSTSSIHPESLLLKEYLFKKLFPMIPFPPKFMIPLPAQKPIPPP